MGCNCKAVRKLDYITKKYGSNTPVSKSTKIKSVLKETVKGLFIWVVMIVLFPVFLCIYLLNRFLFKNKEMKFSKYFKINF